MNKPNLVNIDKFKKKIRNSNNMISLSIQDAKAIDSDIDTLLQYTIELQSQIIALMQPQTTEIHLDGGDFYSKK